MLRSRNILSEEAKQCAKTLIKECLQCYLEIKSDVYGRSVIGYHHFVENKEKDERTTITQKQADKLLEQDLQKVVFREAQCYWGVHLKNINPWRVGALLDATYSCGNIRWPKLTQAVFRQNWDDAAEELMDSRYAHQVDLRAKRNACILRDGKQYTLKNQNWDLDQEE